MHRIVVPRINSNDDSCRLRDWLIADGNAVQKDTEIAVLETSKATVAITADATGVLHPLVQVGEDCAFGSVIAYVFATEQERVAFRQSANHQESAAATTLTITDAARELISKHHISEAQLRALGKVVIRSADLEPFLPPMRADAPPRDTGRQSRRQAAIAKVVSLSHATVPAAHLLIKVYCDNVLAEVKDVLRRGEYIGLPEILVKVVADLAKEFPLFFSSQKDDATVSDPNVGLTLDVGKGLFIPVVRATASKTVQEVAVCVMKFRDQANSDSFRPEDLEDGNISVSVNNHKDVVLALPLIVPGQRAMVSVGGILEEVTLSVDRTVHVRSYVNLGITYDHRYVNGGDAISFLQAMKKRLERGVL